MRLLGVLLGMCLIKRANGMNKPCFDEERERGVRVYVCLHCGNEVISGVTVPLIPNLRSAPRIIPAGMATYCDNGF